MSPEYGATCGIFPVDQVTLDYLQLTGRDPARVALVEAYAKAQGMWRDAETPDPLSTPTSSSSISATVEPSLAGPKRPQDRVALKDAKTSFAAALPRRWPATRLWTRRRRSRARTTPCTTATW